MRRASWVSPPALVVPRQRVEHAQGELPVAGEPQAGGIARGAERERPRGGRAGDGRPGDALAGLNQRDVAVVDVEELGGGGFEVLDQKLYDAVGEARGVEQGREGAQGGVHAEWLGGSRGGGVFGGGLPEGGVGEPSDPCTRTFGGWGGAREGGVLHFVVGGHGRQSSRTIPRNEQCICRRCSTRLTKSVGR